MKVERFARGTVISALGTGAGWISLSHVYKFVMEHSAAGTHWSTGVIVAAVSELMPLGVMLHVRGQKAAGHAVSKLAWAMLLLAGAFSLWAQIATADPGVTGWAVAAFPTLAFMGLVKLMLSHAKDEGAPPERPSVELPELASAPPVGDAETQLGRGPRGVDESVAGSGPAAHTGEGATGPDGDATPTSSSAASGDKRPRKSASRVETAERVRQARLEVERDLGRSATQAEVGERAGCSAATVSRAESRPPQLRIAA